jgi:hypothetical protein
MRANFTITTWLSFGAVIQGLAYFLIGRLAFLPAVALLLYRAFAAYAMSVGWIHDRYMDGVRLPSPPLSRPTTTTICHTQLTCYPQVILKKFSAQFPDEAGEQHSKPAEQDMTVLIIGAKTNHPLGIFAPGYKDLADYFHSMSVSLEQHADEFGFLGMTSWTSLNDGEINNMLSMNGYFKSVDGLHRFAHSEYHREGWDWWNRIVKSHPHLSIFHEVYHAPKGHWENIYINSPRAGITTSWQSFTDYQGSGKKAWASPVVDASRGLLKTSAGRMARSEGLEHERAEVRDVYE